MKRKYKKRKQLNRSKIGNAGIYIVLTILGAFMILPMVYTISSSLKPLDELWVFPPRFLVRNPTTKNSAICSGCWGILWCRLQDICLTLYLFPWLVPQAM